MAEIILGRTRSACSNHRHILMGLQNRTGVDVKSYGETKAKVEAKLLLKKWKADGLFGMGEVAENFNGAATSLVILKKEPLLSNPLPILITVNGKTLIIPSGVKELNIKGENIEVTAEVIQQISL